MAVDKTKMVLTFAHPRITRETQEQEGRRHFDGAEPFIIHVGMMPRLAQDVALATREGDQVWLWALPMLVVKRERAGVGMQAQITLFCRTCAANKATIIEGCTGRTTAKRSQAAAMIDEAHRIIVHGGKRLPKTGAAPGRKRKPWPNSTIEQAAIKLWRSKNIPSDRAAIREAMETWPGVTERLVRSLGPSGRNKR